MSLTQMMIQVQREAVENALDGTEPRHFEPSFSLSIQMMLDNDLLFEFHEQGELREQLARYTLEVLQ